MSGYNETWEEVEAWNCRNDRHEPTETERDIEDMIAEVAEERRRKRMQEEEEE